jgi:hypothetical protein
MLPKEIKALRNELNLKAEELLVLELAKLFDKNHQLINVKYGGLLVHFNYLDGSIKSYPSEMYPVFDQLNLHFSVSCFYTEFKGKYDERLILP